MVGASQMDGDIVSDGFGYTYGFDSELTWRSEKNSLRVISNSTTNGPTFNLENIVTNLIGHLALLKSDSLTVWDLKHVLEPNKMKRVWQEPSEMKRMRQEPSSLGECKRTRINSRITLVVENILVE